MKRRVSGISIEIAVIVSLVLIIANVLLGAVMVHISNVAMREQIRDRMLDVSNTAANMLDGDVLKSLQKEDKGTPQYQEVNRILSIFLNNIGLSYIYTVRDMGNDEFTFMIDPDAVSPAGFGDPIAYTEALHMASTGTPAVDKVPYEDMWGCFYSAYSPVFDSQGQVAGIVAVDFDAEWYEKQNDKQNLVIIVGSILSALIGLGLILLSTKRLRKQLRTVSALSSEYRSIYDIDLDQGEGVCYQPHSHLEHGLRRGERFKYMETVRQYAREHVTEEYRDSFLIFMEPESIRSELTKEPVITFRYMVRRNGKESYEMVRAAHVIRTRDRDDGKVHAIGLAFMDVDAETLRMIAQNRTLRDALAKAESKRNAREALSDAEGEENA